MRLHQKLLLLVALLVLILPTKSLATDWEYPFVVWEGYIYEVTDEYVTDVDIEVGEVTAYSDMEQLSGNFSNTYEVGTKYYTIKGESSDEVIAVEEIDGKYVKAVKIGEYSIASGFQGMFNGQVGIVPIIIIGGFIALFIFYERKLKRIRE
ncbi:hypothetical protein IMZ08_16360 [Bacillus luteolus]|uniref:Uncharacterized protein n=1 Tax=Litchfieldia luteola TaxID=682179 RepID=A0ABR9QMA8_9BACI|nr:hypothetical protein [Cytobacillus luteolus]MBE4909627.1 hypothetical protein [Cytobacillus luteolus]MBP1941028.1 hypothetical protein [Cytobacillus luteolus]